MDSLACIAGTDGFLLSTALMMPKSPPDLLPSDKRLELTEAPEEEDGAAPTQVSSTRYTLRSITLN